MNARETVEIMIPTNRGSMTIWSPPEVQHALDAYRDEVALDLGRDVLRDGLLPFLIRLVGESNAVNLLDAYRAAILNSAAEALEKVTGETWASRVVRRLAAGAES